jgi:hypothetical protein
MDENELLELGKAIVEQLEAADDNNFPSKLQNAIQPIAKVARKIWAGLGNHDLYAKSEPVWRDVREVLSRAVRLINPDDPDLWWIKAGRVSLDDIVFLAGVATDPEHSLKTRQTTFVTLQEIVNQAREQNSGVYDTLRFLVRLVPTDPVWESETVSRWAMDDVPEL